MVSALKSVVKFSACMQSLIVLYRESDYTVSTGIRGAGALKKHFGEMNANTKTTTVRC